MTRDARLMAAMPVIAALFVGALYFGEWVHHAGAVPVATTEARK